MWQVGYLNFDLISLQKKRRGLPIRKTDKQENLDDMVVVKVSKESLTGRSALAGMLLLLMFLSIFSVLTSNAEAIDGVPYDDIGTEWTKNPNLIISGGSWDSRVWQWSTNSLELQHSDANNYVTWNVDGQVSSQAQDELGEPYKASNFDQGYEKFENEIYDLNEWGDWSNKACSLRVEGSVTVFDGVGYTGSNRTFTSDAPDLGIYDWNSKASSLKLSQGSQVTIYSQTGYNGDSRSFVYPSYQPEDLKVADKSSITLEGVINNWYTDTWTVPGWTGAKFDVFAVEDRNSNTGKTLMLEMYFLRDGANLAWSALNFLPGCSGNEREGFRGPPFQSAYNYLVALDAFPGIANITSYPGNMAKWTIDVKALIQRACDHDWGVSPSDYQLDIDKLNIVKVSFAIESANLGRPVRASCTLNRLRLAYTGVSTSEIYSENAYDKPQSGVSWSKVSDSSSLSGFVMKAAVSSPNEGMLFGPYIAEGSDGSILAGKPYTATFKLKVSSNVLNDNVVYLDVCYNLGIIIKSRLFRANDFAAPNMWQSFELPFVAPINMIYGIEFRVSNRNNGAADLFVDEIILHRDWNSSTIYFEGALSKLQSGSSWVLVSDPSAFYGQVREAPSSAQNYACLYGPYIKNVAETELNAVPLIVSFRLKISSNVPIQTVAQIDVAFNAGTVLRSEQIKANDFTSPNRWQEFAMSILVPDTLVYGLEFRVINRNNGIADLFVDRISVAVDNSVVYSQSASDKPNSGTSWSKWGDQTSLSGTVMRASSTSSNGEMLYGPYIKTDKYGAEMQGMSYTAVFRMKISSNVATGNSIYLDICYDLGIVLAQEMVKASDFDSPNTWQTFQIIFNVPATMVYGLEFRVRNLNYAIADVCVDKITVSKGYNSLA
jgi:hypothetical protein